MEKSLTVYQSTLDASRPLLMQAMARGDTTGGAATLDDLCHGAPVFELRDETGRPIGAYVLAMRDHAAARVCWVMAAGGSAPGVDLTGQVLPCVERQARTFGAGQVAITTRRRGLKKKLEAQGYELTGWTFRKKL
ncbi:hypothetical protein [Acidovorax delafieldii]|uniref:hypothetical protein n=1 Tax=Acidovorax delafieldii TaxID=47920 RepID=UPI003ED03583